MGGRSTLNVDRQRGLQIGMTLTSYQAITWQIAGLSTVELLKKALLISISHVEVRSSTAFVRPLALLTISWILMVARLASMLSYD